MMSKTLASSLFLPLLFAPFANAGYSYSKCYNIAYSNASTYYSSSSTIHPCGNDVYNTCCEIGDYCITGGFCESPSFSSYSEPTYYLGGCTDPEGEDIEACGGYCPRGTLGSGSSSTANYYSYLVWQTGLQEWMCCPSTTSSSAACVAPVAPDGGSIDNEYSDPSDLVRTASVVGSSSFTSYGYGYSATASSSSYYGYGYPSSTPYNYGSGGYGSGPSANNDYGYPYGFSYTLLVIVIVVPVLVGSFLIAMLIWLIVHKCRKANRKAAAAAAAAPMAGPGNWPIPQGQVVYPYVMAGQGQSAADAQRDYEQKMAAAGWVARQPPEVAMAQQQQTQQQGQNPDMRQVDESGLTQPTSAITGAPRGGSRALSPGGNTANQASWLPPIQEVAPIDNQDIAAAAAVPTPSATEANDPVAAESAVESARGQADAGAATTATESVDRPEAGEGGSSWPLSSSTAEPSQPISTNTAAGAGEAAVAEHAPNTNPAPRRSGDLYD